jgi:hypothetical protein
MNWSRKDDDDDDDYDDNNNKCAIWSIISFSIVKLYLQWDIIIRSK